MSTKTSIKRIALVAVSALGFGMLSIVPSNAAFVAGAMSNGEVENLTIATSGTGRVGTASTATITVDYTADSEDGDDPTLRGRFLSKPAGSTATIAFTGAGDQTGMTFTAANAAGNELLDAKAAIEVAAVVDGDAVVGTALTKVGFVPDVAGSYVVQVWLDLDEDGVLDSNEQDEEVDTETFTVGAAPTAITVTRINSTTTTSGTSGALVKIALTNAAGAAGLAAGESITIDPDDASADITLAGDGTSDTATDGAAATASPEDFVGGILWLNVDDNGGDAGSIVVTVSGVGSAISSLTAQFTITTVAADNDFTGTFTPGTTGNAAYGATVGTATADDAAPDRTVPLGSSSITYTLETTAGLAAEAYTSVNITDDSGRVTGSYVQSKTGLAYDLAVQNSGTAAAGEGSFSVSMTSTAIDQKFTITAAESDALAAAEIVSDTIDMDGGSVTVSPSASITAATGSTLTYSVLVKDQFARALTSGTVTMSIAGRNATTAATQQVKSLDSTGRASFTITDAPAAGVTATADTVTFTALDQNGQNLDGTASITWGTQTVSTVVLTGGNTTAGVTATTVTNKDISAADGAEAGVQTFSATVKDASGNLLAGTPVTWTISGTGAAVLSTTATSYTSALGVATTSVYGWIAGTYTVTATAGGKSGTGTITFAQVGTGEERTISASVEGSVVSAKVVDRFGNPVSGVTVYASKTGAGYFGNGVTKTSTTTNSAGIAEFVVAGGSATVTVSTISYDAVAGTKGSGQTSSLKGYSDSATTPTAFTAYTAGTATVAEEGVGASYDAAGVDTASVEVNATATSDSVDAANEATDAANAATDAANAAAEAADAATAAAQDAQAAVAALATEVAAMISGIKAQIIRLTNLVVKIQKKVKA